jgi:hypothetical protein
MKCEYNLIIISYIAVPANIEITTEPKTKAILIPEKKIIP